MPAGLHEDARLQATAATERVAASEKSNSDVCHDLPRCGPTDQALSCRPPVSVPGSNRRAPAESTPNRAAAGRKPWQVDPVAAGQLQCLP